MHYQIIVINTIKLN